MHLRHLIVLIIHARNWPAPLEKAAWSSGKERFNHVFRRACLIGQIKKNQNSRAVAVSPRGCRVKQAAKHLFTMSKDPAAALPEGGARPNLLSNLRRFLIGAPTRLLGNKKWWSRTESNRRHPACKAGALPTELRPRWKRTNQQKWWARVDSNYRPHAYQACALTT